MFPSYSTKSNKIWRHLIPRRLISLQQIVEVKHDLYRLIYSPTRATSVCFGPILSESASVAVGPISQLLQTPVIGFENLHESQR